MTGIEDLLRAGSRSYLARNGVPTDTDRADRERARALLLELLGDQVGAEGLGLSPLGVEWTDVFTVHLDPGAGLDEAVLHDHGWVCLDPLWDKLATTTGTTSAWAIVSQDRVLAAARFTRAPTDPVRTVLERARALGQVRLREMLELRSLAQNGHALPETSKAVRAAADIESSLGGRDLVRWTSGRRLAAPVAIGRPAGAPRRFLVAVSGVDGAGKSHLTEALASNLTRAGVPVSQVWLRPGMGLGPAAALAGRVKRRLGVDPRPGVGVVASGPAVELRSRRGMVGWVWSLLVTVMFVIGVRSQHGASRGVVLWDRHVLDALTTLDFVYGGVDLGLQRRLVRRLLPPADAAFYLDVPIEVALARKPADLMGEHAVGRQLDAYDHWLSALDGIQVVDACRPADALAMQTFRNLVAADE